MSGAVDLDGIPDNLKGIFSRLQIENGRMRRILAGRDVTLRLHESEHTRLVRALEDQRSYAGRLLQRVRDTEALERHWRERAVGAEAALRALNEMVAHA